MSRMSGNIDFEIHPIIVWNSFCILLFLAGENCLYLLNRKSDFDEVFSKTKLSGCFTKYTTNLKFDSAWHETHFAWQHHIFFNPRIVHRLFACFCSSCIPILYVVSTSLVLLQRQYLHKSKFSAVTLLNGCFVLWEFLLVFLFPIGANFSIKHILHKYNLQFINIM